MTKDIFTADQVAVLADTLGDLMREVDRRITLAFAMPACGVRKIPRTEREA